MTKKSKGRQKIEMVKMKNESNLQVTFSKRRSGLFKKASELCTLCGAEVALIVFSPGRKVFSFGHPNVETVIDRFLNNNPPPSSHQTNIQPNDAHRNSLIRQLNDELTKLVSNLESEKKKNEELKKVRENSKKAQHWWEDAIEGFTLAQCKGFKGSLENLKKSVTLEASKFFQAHQNYYVGSSSNAAFGVGGGGNINPDLDFFGQRRMINMNAFISNQNMIPPNHAVQFGNNGPEGVFPNYNMNYPPGFNQNQDQNQIQMQNQNQTLTFKRENISEYDEHHHGHPPHPRRDYY